MERLMVELVGVLGNAVAVYDTDHLGRPLADFAKFVEVCNRNDPSFVSAAQTFNITASMGRLTHRMLRSIVQFERGVTAERIRDKVAARRKRGMWMGGVPPFAYRVENHNSPVDNESAKHVRWTFARFLEIGSRMELSPEVDACCIRSPRGIRFDKKHIYRMLSSHACISESVHKGDS